MGKFFITTPIYYVNDEPHIGHAYTTVMADVLARYHRITGDEVLFLTGTDEHGQKVEQAAKNRGVSPQDHCNEMVIRFQSLWKTLNVSNDDFIRTTESRHVRVVQDCLQRIFDIRDIYSDDYEGWYCIPDERFWTEKDLKDGNCPACGRSVIQISERNYFFRMNAYQEWLIQHINSHPKFIQPETRRNEVLGFLKNPLNDLCISRPKTRLKWGIPLPFDDDYVCYVWFDALINYITSPGYLQNEKEFEFWWPASCQLIGKDILTTHCVYWPTMLKAMGLPIPETVLAHGWWTIQEEKMSKSIGNVVRPLDLANDYGVDAFRYFLVREMMLGLDSNFSEEAFVKRYNSDLANDLGNLLNRTIVMTRRYLDGQIPDVDPKHPALEAIKEQAQNTIEGVLQSLKRLEPNGILEAILKLVREANRFVEIQAPWNLAKDPNGRLRLEITIYGLLETMRYLAILLFPVIPGKAQEIWDQIGAEGEIGVSRVDDLKQWGGLRPGRNVKPARPIFPRIEGNTYDKPKGISKKLEVPKMSKENADLIPFSQFQKLKFRVARVIEVEKVKDTDRLLKLQISLGDETRQLVAGVAQHYSPESLVGRQIVVVINLEPATIRGVESQGMLLAASEGPNLSLLQPDSEIPDGSEIK